MKRLYESMQEIERFPNGRDWSCRACGHIEPEDSAADRCPCGGKLTRVTAVMRYRP